MSHKVGFFKGFDMHLHHWLARVAVPLLIGLLSLPVARADVETEIFDIFDDLNQGIQPQVLPQALRASETLDLFYAARNYRPAWDHYANIEPVLAELGASTREGLEPEDYHYSLLRSLEAGYFDAFEQKQRDRLRAAFDVLLTDAVLLYARHLQEGKVDPGRIEPTWNFSRVELTPAELAARLQEALAAGDVVARLESFKPELRFYALAKAELARYRALAASGELPTVPSEKTLREGMRHENVRALREHLSQRGYDVGDAQDPILFDSALASAVRDLQALHTLDADGVVGAATFAALNTPLSSRIDQLRLNLDRIRWVKDDIAEELVVVNIAGFELFYFRDSAIIWKTDVMVGQIRYQTPIFRNEMTYMEFNPTWTVPRSIIQRSLFSKFSANPGSVASNDYTLYDADGREVDPLALDWSLYSLQHFPFRVVQQPGPGNAMGRVKFMFPNQYAIYLHDTPARSMFSRTSRAFSAGCIRVENPLHFAELLLDDNPDWDRARIDRIVDSGERRVVRLGRPVDIMLMYWTASPTADGRIRFHPDIYDKDARSLRLLDETPVRFTP